MKYLLLLLLALAAPQEPATAPAKTWRILVVNDDGIDASGLKALVAALDPLGEVVVCAPATNRSGSSRSTEMLIHPLKVAAVVIPGADAAWSVDGTPADASAYGVVGLGGERGFDLAVSGINAGSNVGGFAYLSGTVGAALEAASLGVPAFAVSLDRGGSEELAARYAADFARAWLARGAQREVVYTINVPRQAGAEPPAAKAGRVGPEPYQLAGFTAAPDGSMRARLAPLTDLPSSDTDTAQFAAGAITVTPLRLDWTDAAALQALASWLPAARGAPPPHYQSTRAPAQVSPAPKAPSTRYLSFSSRPLW